MCVAEIEQGGVDTNQLFENSEFAEFIEFGN